MRSLLASALPSLLLALLVAGCAADPASGPEPTATGPGTDLTATGSTTSTGPGVAAAPIVSQAVPFSWSGHTKEGAWVCMEQAGTGQCPAGQQVAPDGAHVTAIAYAGNLTRIEVTMTWQADPTQTGLVLAAYGNTSSGRGPLATVQGDSPLALALDTEALRLAADNAIVLMAWPEGKTPTSPSLFLDATQQAFTVEGALWQTGPPGPPA